MQIDGVRLVTGDLGAASMDTLRDVAEQFRDKLGAGGVAVLGATDPEGGKVYLAAAVADDVVGRGVQAGKLVGALAKKRRWWEEGAARSSPRPAGASRRTSPTPSPRQRTSCAGCSGEEVVPIF